MSAGLPHPRPPGDFLWLGGDLVLDLLNTRVQTRRGPAEMLPDLTALFRWLEVAGALDARLRTRLEDQTRARPRPVEVLESVWAVREAVRALLDGSPREPALAVLTPWLNRPGLVPTLTLVDGHVQTSHTTRGEDGDDLPTWLAHRAWARIGAGNILTCDNRGCGLFYLQDPKRARRWCDDRLCGQRTRSKESYERTNRPARRRRDSYDPT